MVVLKLISSTQFKQPFMQGRMNLQVLLVNKQVKQVLLCLKYLLSSAWNENSIYMFLPICMHTNIQKDKHTGHIRELFRQGIHIRDIDIKIWWTQTCFHVWVYMSNQGTCAVY